LNSISRDETMAFDKTLDQVWINKLQSQQ
jgi:hypothetical protein